jgi:hypothetical protein
MADAADAADAARDDDCANHAAVFPLLMPFCCATYAYCSLQWERVILTPGPSPVLVGPHELPLLLVITTLSGMVDGIAMGAIFGEAAVLGPSCAHVSRSDSIRTNTQV